jgi:hypothetical protein
MPVNRLLVAASIIYALVGLPLLFAGDEVLRRLDGSSGPAAVWIAGTLGAAVCSMALLNWFNRHTLMGGIYGRPLLLANLLLLSNVTFSGIRMWRMQGQPVFGICTAVGGVLLVLFGRRLFRAPDGVATGGGPAER